MILDEKVTLKWSSKIKSFYVNKGYTFTKMKDTFEVDVKDLSYGSNCKVRCRCDFCQREYAAIFSKVSREQYHSCGDKKCTIEKRENFMMTHFGKRSCSQVDEFKKKKRETFLKHYPDKESRKEMRKRLEDTREQNTGYRSPFHDPKIREKAKQTLINETGYDNPWKNKVKQRERQVKIAETLSKNQTCKVSKFQKHLSELLNAKTNVNIDVYLADIVFDNVVIEYDGPGHFSLGKISHSKEEMKEQEDKRNQVILDHGYKIIHIVSKSKPKINDDFLLKLINFCKSFNLVYIDLDNEIIRGDLINMKFGDIHDFN